MADVDLSEFEALITRAAKRPCQIAGALERLASAEHAKLHAACAQDKAVIPATAIVAWLKARGIDTVSVQGVARHRRAECACHG